MMGANEDYLHQTADACTLSRQLHIHILLFIPIVLWIWIWPYTGDGDSVLHYLCARTVWSDPTAVLGSWARPLHKLLIIIPALGGIIPTRLFQAFLTLVMAWQTVSLARQLGLRNSLLAAPLVVAQPYIFALAGDTMTEIPMALATLIGVRLWLSGRLAWSCLVVSMLPLLRPEGFFMIALWGILLLLPRTPGAGTELSSRCPGFAAMVRTRFLPACLLSVGLLGWMLACWLITRDPLYFIHIWSWPMRSYDSYKPGPIYHYVLLWPVYCGLVLTVPFIAGILPSICRPRMRLIWIIWLLVIVLHSLLYWLHKFASVGLLRILACTAPMTALICLEGFNAIGRWLADRGVQPAARHRLAVGAVVLAMLWAMFFYTLFGVHYDCFGYRRLAREANSRQFLAAYYRQQSNNDPNPPRIIAGDKMFLAMMGLNAAPPHYMDSAMDRQSQLQRMASQPIGTVGAWDNQQALGWHSISIDDLPALGYMIVYEYDQTVPDLMEYPKSHSLFSRQRYVLIRKDRN